MLMRRRTVTVTAFAAAAALVLSACGGDEPTETDPTDDTDVEDTEDDEADDEEATDDEAPSGGTVVYAAEQEFASYNNNTADQNAFRNTLILNGVLDGFWVFNPAGFAEPNEVLGTYSLVSEDPQTVEYVVNDEATWSDGTPIACADMLLTWAANSGAYQSGETNEDGDPLPLFSTAGTAGYEDWAKPDCNVEDKTLTVVYDNVYATWEAIDPVQMPAHIVAEQGGLTLEEFIEAIRNDDVDALRDAAAFYNSGWVMNPGELLDEALMPSSGPYKISEWIAGESLTLTLNEDYYGPAPANDSVVFRFLDQDQMAQALQNGEVDVIDPQPNPDLLNQLEGMAGVVVETADQFVYEHLDFNMGPDQPFADRDLREAFALCVPRERIVENLIRPQNPQAEVLQARLTYSFQPDYADQVAATNAADYAEQDIEAAAAILEEKGMVGMDVRIGYQQPNPRRTNQVELIRDACNEAGFNVIDNGADDFFGVGLDQGDFEVALFAWVGSAYVSGAASTFQTPEACAPGSKGNNNGCYSSAEVDDLFGQLLTELDPDAARELVKQIEAILWADLPTIPLFTFPGLAAWAEDVQGVETNFSQGGITWNLENWSRS
jgi:peptide/nickel transport system substrate-binding protein